MLEVMGNYSVLFVYLFLEVGIIISFENLLKIKNFVCVMFIVIKMDEIDVCLIVFYGEKM